jgi:hypothetical protein
MKMTNYGGSNYGLFSGHRNSDRIEHHRRVCRVESRGRDMERVARVLQRVLRSHVVRLIVVSSVIVAAVWCSSALADDQHCYGMPPLSVDAGVAPTLAIVKPGDRARFVKGGEQAGCPSASAACAARAFVVGGDVVVVSATAGDYACATFTGPGPKAASTSGFLPRAQLAAPPPEAPINAATAWAGTWQSGDEQTITIHAKPDGRIVIQGDATWGGQDPERIKRGAVNAGNISAEVSIAGGVAAFTDDGGATKPFDVKLPDDSGVCRVKLWRLGPYLVAADNLGCGGMNVTFTGVYRKTGA